MMVQENNKMFSCFGGNVKAELNLVNSDVKCSDVEKTIGFGTSTFATKAYLFNLNSDVDK